VNKKYKNDKEFVKKILKINSLCYEFLDELKNDEEIVIMALKDNCTNFYFVPEIMKYNKDIFLEAARSNGEYALVFASEYFKSDK
jgi:hypothetical protein